MKDAEDKWNRDFKEFWDHTSITAKKIFSIIHDNLEERASEQEEFEIEETASPNKFRLYEFFAESISIGLSRPSKLDIINLVAMSLSNKEKPLLEMLSEPEAEQKE